MLYGLTPQKIPVADKPLRLGGKVEYLTIEAFQEKFGFRYTETLETGEFRAKSKPVVSENVTGYVSAEELKSQLRKILTKPREDLAICHINDKVGYGLFALADIPKDTVLFFYAGTFKESQVKKAKGDHSIEYWGMDAMVTTDSHRGIASFLQHFPSPLKFPDIKQLQWILAQTGQNIPEETLKLQDELYSITFQNEEARRNLATENVRKEYINVDGDPVLVFVTNAAIHKGDQLGFNYGYTYWLGRNTVPEFFDKTGAIIPSEQYRRNCGQLTCGETTYQGEFHKLIEQIKLGKTHVTLIDTAHVSRAVPCRLVIDELLRVRAIPPKEHELLLTPAITSKTTKAEPLAESTPQPAGDGFFSNLKLMPLISKYELANTTQGSLEKGLRKAANSGNVEDLKIFIKHVKNINAKDPNPNSQKTALYWATQKGHTSCCDLLVAAGAVPDDQEPADQLGKGKTLK